MNSKEELKSKIEYKTCLSYLGYILRKSKCSDQELSKVKKELTVQPLFIPGYGSDEPEKYKIYQENANKLYLPVYYGIKNFGSPEVIKTNQGLKINCPFNGSLRPIQKKIVKTYFDSLIKNDNENKNDIYLRGGGVISAGCGVGKTTMSLYILSTLGVKGLIVVHNEVLLNQWKERIAQYLPTARIGIIQGPKQDISEKDVVIGMLKSLGMKKYPDYVFRDFGLVIYDECHHTSAKMFSKALSKTRFRFTIGLSATPKRKDGLTNVFLWHLGDIVFKQKKDKDSGVNVIIYKYLNEDPTYSKTLLNYKKKPNHVQMLTNIANCQKRNKFIASLLPPLLKEERKILILTERLSEIKWFYDYLESFLKSHQLEDITFGKYVGGMKETALEESQSCHILLGTYNMIEEGFDCKELDTLIMATPKTDIEQASGRILRLKPEDRVRPPLIIDIWDIFCNFKNKGLLRMKYYKKKDYSTKLYEVDDNLKSKTIKLISSSINSSESNQSNSLENKKETTKPLIKIKFSDDD